MTTRFTFAGEWGPWITVILGLLLAGLAFWLYRRETRKRNDWLGWALPLLRSLAVFWIFMMLSGPVLRHREVIGELAQVIVVADTSQSMALTDEAMSAPRRLLIAQKFGFAQEGTVNLDLSEASQILDQASQEAARFSQIRSSAEIEKAADALNRSIQAAQEVIAAAPGEVWTDGESQLDSFRKEVSDPAAELAKMQAGRDNSELMNQLKSTANAAARWSNRLQDQFDAYVARKGNSSDAGFAAGMAKVDELSRWQRMEMHLLEGNESFLQKLGEEHQLQFAILSGKEANVVWSPTLTLPGEENPFPDGLEAGVTNTVTDLNSGLAALVDQLPADKRSAIVLLSDGQHNSGETPLKQARVLGARGIPVYTVGFGPTRKPADLAILDVDAPETVFYQADIKGSVRIKDDMPIGDEFKLVIRHQGKEIWEQTMQTQGGTQHTVDFSFPVIDILRRELGGKDKDLRYNAVPVELEVGIEPLAGEKESGNNTAKIRFNGITRKPKVLLIDGRPRWEYRYLKTLFERDEAWAINHLLAGQGGELVPWQRGDTLGTFPKDKETLFSYQLIILGDVPVQMFQGQELEWIRSFVEDNGGGIIFIDGHQYRSANFSQTPVGSLLPAQWKTSSLTGSNLRFQVQDSPTADKYLSLKPQGHLSERLWQMLPAPKRVASSTPLPGSETLIKVTNGAITTDAMIFRRQGGGRVLYIGFDESWRWRYGVGDLYHQRYWNQLARWIMEPAYTVEDNLAALDSGPITYEPGDTASIRARIRDHSGRLLLEADASAILFKDGHRAATIRLESDSDTGGVFRGETAELEPGSYEVKLQVEGIPSQNLKVSTTFEVMPQGASELTHLEANEDMLRQMAGLSGGRFFREENMNTLSELLAPMSQGKITESETVLWQSWWWFLPFIILVTLEWALRKKAGLL